MSYRLRFLQDHCLVLSLKLFHSPVSLPNELLWTKSITYELNKICNVLYARTTLSYNGNSIARKQPRLDLVLSSFDVSKLSNIIFNLRGVELKESAIPAKYSVSSMEESFGTPKENKDLSILYESLLARWKVINHGRDCKIRELQPLINLSPLLFNSKAAKHVFTTSKNLFKFSDSINLPYKYEVKDHPGSRFLNLDRFAVSAKDDPQQYPGPRINPHNHLKMDENAREFHKFIQKYKQSESNHYLALTPELYQDFDSLPTALQKWLHDIEKTEIALDKSKPGGLDELDILLHGFEGFSQR